MAAFLATADLHMKLAAAFFLVFWAVSAASGGTWYSSPDARAGGSGSREDPAALERLLRFEGPVGPGDTVVLLEGVYSHRDRGRSSRGFVVNIAGEEEMPITIRGERGKRVTIDGRVTINPRVRHVIVRDLEILVMENFMPENRVTETSSDEFEFPAGGLLINGGHRNKFVNLVIHKNASGIYFWQRATDSQVYGCIIYDNGWQGPQRGHGHAIYLQGRAGYKSIEDCIMTGGYGWTMHGYSERPQRFVNNVKLQGNIVYDSNRFLVGGLNPSSNILLTENYFFNSGRVDVGYHLYEGWNENCIVMDNVFVDTPFEINRFRDVTKRDNVVVDTEEELPGEDYRVIVRENKYDGDRAHVAIYNWKGAESVGVDFGGFIGEGDAYRFMDPVRFYGEPVAGGVYEGGEIEVPVDGMFAAYVLLVERRGGAD